jgi:hypothetical protein
MIERIERSLGYTAARRSEMIIRLWQAATSELQRQQNRGSDCISFIVNCLTLDKFGGNGQEDLGIQDQLCFSLQLFAMSPRRT